MDSVEDGEPQARHGRRCQGDSGFTTPGVTPRELGPYRTLWWTEQEQKLVLHLFYVVRLP
jgi:hypothetical protein